MQNALLTKLLGQFYEAHKGQWYNIYIYIIYIHVIMKTICYHPGCHHNYLVITTCWALFGSLVHYQKCVTVHHVPKCMSCHKAIIVITGRAHCFHDNIYITLILLLWDFSTLCVVDHLSPLIYIYIYTCI